MVGGGWAVVGEGKVGRGGGMYRQTESWDLGWDGTGHEAAGPSPAAAV